MDTEEGLDRRRLVRLLLNVASAASHGKGTDDANGNPGELRHDEYLLSRY
jgi:hypothetical protein